LYDNYEKNKGTVSTNKTQTNIDCEIKYLFLVLNEEK